jgi:hypothetical protein
MTFDLMQLQLDRMHGVFGQVSLDELEAALVFDE